MFADVLIDAISVNCHHVVDNEVSLEDPHFERVQSFILWLQMVS